MFLPRRKEGEDPDVPRHISVSYKSLEGLFHLPLNDAAREIGLCPTTFKKACRRFDLETWPFRKGRSFLAGQAPIARRTDGVDAVKVSCTTPVWNGGTSTFSSIVSSDVRASAERHQDCIKPVSSSAAPHGLLQQASTALDTKSYGAAQPAFQLKTCAPSYADAFKRGTSLIRNSEAGPPDEQSCTEAVMEYLDLGCSISAADVAAMLSNDL